MIVPRKFRNITNILRQEDVDKFANVLTKESWRILKKNSYIREIVAFTYYFFRGTRRRINGKSNDIQINLQGSIPRLKNTSFYVNGSDNLIVISSGVRIENTKIEIQGNSNKLLFEENCYVNGGCLWLKDYECKLKIGKSTTIQEAHIGVSEPKSSVVIGEDCMLAHGIDIRCSDSHSIIDLDSNERINYARDISIGNHVWIAMYARILKGVNIGSHSIIASGSIVTKDVPENCIVSGVPAQVKRTGVTWLRENIPK